MIEPHTVQAFAESHAKLFLENNPECRYDLLDLQYLVNFAVLKWENPEHRKALRNYGHAGMEELMKLFSKYPPVASDWIKLIHQQWMNLPEQKKDLIRRKKGVREIQDNTAEDEIHYGERHLRRVKAELKKAEAEFVKAELKKAEAEFENTVTSKKLPSEKRRKAP